MPLYEYEAKDDSGKQVKGELLSDSRQAAVASLRAKNIYVFSVFEKPEKATATGMNKDLIKKKVKKKDISVFCRQFAIMLHAGVPLPVIFGVMIKQEKNNSLKEILESINADILKGKTLSSSMAQHKIFSTLMTSMVEVGEANGRLDVAFERISTDMEKSLKLKAKIKGAMIYPIVLLSICLLVCIVLIVFVLPRFSEMFTSMGAELPGTTKVFLGISSFVINYWYILIGAVLLIVGILYKILHDPVAKFQIDKGIFNVPLIGNIQNTIFLANFCRTFSSLIEAGVGVVAALEVTKNVNDNLFAKECVEKITADVQSGATISQSISRFKIFSPLIVSMVKIGEESGNLGDTLSRTADIYEEEADNALQGLSTLMEPAVTVFMAIIIGFIVISVVQPMFSMYSVVGQQK